MQSKLLGWRARVRKGSKYDKHTYLNPDRKEFKTKGEVRAERGDCNSLIETDGTEKLARMGWSTSLCFLLAC